MLFVILLFSAAGCPSLSDMSAYKVYGVKFMPSPYLTVGQRVQFFSVK
jgi:hypothetical protein